MERQFNAFFTKLTVSISLLTLLASCGSDAPTPSTTTPSPNATQVSTVQGQDTTKVNNPVANTTPTISFDSASNAQLQLRGQGGIENTIVTFKVANVSNQPLSNMLVDFELSNNIGSLSFIGDSSATSDAEGLVSAIVQGGAFPTSFSVTATINGTTTRAVSNEIAISSGTFSGASFPLSAVVSDTVKSGEKAIEAESAGELGGIEVELQLITTDQFGHKVLDGARITIVSPETGLVVPSTCVLEEGVCKSKWISSTSGLIDEYITLIAYASGAESFEDTNGNNIYELHEEHTDLGEAYADENGNGAYDVGEFFVDANRNKKFDPKGNGVWDGPCIDIPDEAASDRQARCAGNRSTVISDQLVLKLLAAPPEEGEEEMKEEGEEEMKEEGEEEMKEEPATTP